jgi:hypothetical protein
MESMNQTNNYSSYSEEVQCAIVSNNAYDIKQIAAPSEAVQLTAVKQNGYAIEAIKNPSETV